MRSNEKLRAEMYGFIRRWEHSGLSQRAFCESEGINYYKFKYWKAQQNKDFPQQKQSEPKQGFIPINAPGFESSFSKLEFSFPNGVKLSCGTGLQPSQIIELIKLF